MRPLDSDANDSKWYNHVRKPQITVILQHFPALVSLDPAIHPIYLESLHTNKSKFPLPCAFQGGFSSACAVLGYCKL